MEALKVRVISLNKREGQSFGFYLRVEQGEDGHLIRNLEMGSPAELSGLKDGDRLLRVNGTFVDTLEHHQVVDLVKNSRMSVTFHVLDEASYKQAKETGVDLSDPQPSSQSSTAQAEPVMNGVTGSAPKPKLCFLVKDKNGYGFSIKSTKGMEGVYMTAVTASGVADRAGVKVSDHLQEVNGENVDGCTHEEIAEKIKAAGDRIMFLLVDEQSDKYYRNRKLKPRAEDATTRHLPHAPRIADMTKGPDGYGFYLREDPKTKGHFINDIEQGSPAEKAGLKNMDRLVAVSGEEVNHLDHDEVVDRIQGCGLKCSLLVVDEETDKMYKMGGVSPFLYWKEMKGVEPITALGAEEPAPVLGKDTPPAQQLKPKLCRMEKTSSGFGFHLNGIQGVPGQYIQEVVTGGVADRAGLKNDDIVVEVNGVNVEDSTHEEAVALIRASGDRLTLLVAEKKAYDYFKAEKIPITPQLLGQTPTPQPEPADTATQIHTSKSQDPQRRDEEKNEKEKAEEKEEEATAEATPPGEPKTRDRTPSSSSSSSSSDEDERL
ncbi:Na(+)/H(+) exchange regulatory cofactor NHE-RF3 [Brienomyrus brachyistius]|uniref:Na(+)/H(+) exchange regulatory cofactor NHE-RF3 n=1 Tax=Brienomyrus brachyistius TaxID=42636 RepID=UPI0020B2B696|nr:Na(+)/H(+) exchange regulatory cofactor NHE-RF3 [Brienomyrus brachyistius]